MSNLIRNKFYSILEKKDLTQLQVAQNAEMDHTSLSRTLRENSDPRVSTVQRIAKGLGIEAWQLFVDESANEVGPLSSDEILLVLNFRRIPSETKRKMVQEMVEAFSE